MHLTYKCLFAMIGVATGVMSVDGCGVRQRGAGGSREFLSMPFAYEGDTLVWNVGHEAGNDVERVTEFVRPGQTVEDWTELVTVQTLNKAVGLNSVDEMVAAHRADLAARCPGSTLEVLQRQPDGVLYESRAVNCEAGADEHGLGRVLDGHANRFVVQYAVRESVTMTPERRARWIDELLALQITMLPGGR